MSLLSSTVMKAALAAGGMVLVAVIVVLAIFAARGGEEDSQLLADSMAGQPTEVIVGGGTAMVWATAPDSVSDPRPGGGPDPGLCTLTGQGRPVLVDPNSTDTKALGESTLYPIARVEDYSPPMSVTCSGGSIDHVYVTGSPDPS